MAKLAAILLLCAAAAAQSGARATVRWEVDHPWHLLTPDRTARPLGARPTHGIVATSLYSRDNGTAVSPSRVIRREQFPSGVSAGSLPKLLARRILNRQSASAHAAAPEVRATSHASAYVPLESWIYPALDRLAALGLLPSQTSGLRPWTRAECRRQLHEAERRAPHAINEAAPLLQSLHTELDRDSAGRPSITLDALYLRNGAIAGPVLNDSFHFGQTWSNDQGRPFGRGWNSYSGFTARAEVGRFFTAAQVEYQHAPGAEPYTFPVRQAIARLDGVPVQDAAPADAPNRFRSIEAYAGIRIANLQFSVGKQALWWGPTNDSPLSFGSNSEPTKNVKLSTISPIRVGPIRVRGEFILGKLGGHRYTWRPWFNAQKLSFKLTENLEVGFTRWSIFWGTGHPITLGTFARNFTVVHQPRWTGRYRPLRSGRPQRRLRFPVPPPWPAQLAYGL